MTEKFVPKEITLGNLIKTNKFFIPKYQRYFSWTIEAETFLDDVISLINNTEDFFTGPMIFSRGRDRFTVVDGQQRLITTSIILSVIRDLCNNKGITDVSQEIESKYLKEKEVYSSGEKRLIPNRVDGEMYDLIVNSSESRDVKETLAKQKIRNKKFESWRNMWKFYVHCYEELKEYVRGLQQTEARTKLARIVEIFDKSVKIISIEVKDDIEAYLIFETLNDRGLQLSISDLLKNYLFSKLNNDSLIDEYEVRWTNLLDDLPASKFVQLIRYYWISKHGLVREKDLYRKIKDQINSTEHVKEIISDLEIYKRRYNQIVSPSFDIWKSSRLVDCLDDLRSSSFSQHIPIIFSLLAKESEPLRTEDKIWSLYVVAIRRILSGKNPNEIEKQISKICTKIAQGDYDGMKSELEYLNPSNEEIESAVKNTLFTTTKEKSLAKAVLRIINNQDSQQMSTNKDLTLEHILAESNATDFPDPSVVSNIGNFTLLTDSENRNVGNRRPSDKLPVLKQSPLEINKELCRIWLTDEKINEFSTVGIENRAEHIIKKVCSILAL